MDEFTSDPMYSKYVLDRYGAIAEARPFSIETITKIREITAHYFETNPAAKDVVSCVAICGSLARLEGCPYSDRDIVTVVTDATQGDRIHNGLLNLIAEKTRLPNPNPKGVFAKPCLDRNLASIAGDQDENYRVFSQRLLFVLESKWIWDPQKYNAHLLGIIDQYSALVDADPRKTYVFLLNDVIRYFRTICVNYQFNTQGDESGKWPIRNVKLRHSRVLMYFSLLAAIGELSVYYEEDKKTKLLEYISLTPLERIFKIYYDRRDHSWFRFFGYYDTFLRILNSDGVRKKLSELDYDDRYKSQEFAMLKANSDALAAEIVRFIMARRHIWSDRFFEYLVL